MESKPLISYAGDTSLFDSLHFGICQNLPVESVEWRRSFGRAPKKVYVECSFRKFAEDVLPTEGDWKLLDQAFFHSYWTDCVDVDQYKASVRDDISRWLSVLRNHDIHDWLIICVETMDSHRKAAKTKLLPRASVVDKMKSDFCSRSQDNQRCLSLLDPLKSDTRGAESWQSFLGRIRQLLLHAYNRRLSRFEEHMRSQRERRQEADWSFCQYFLLQEELAFVFEMLGIYDEALVQYDELDALFTQFVLNSNAGDTPKWLGQFSGACDSWRGMRLSTRADKVARARIGDGVASLLELRNYLFSRQCSLLLLLYRPWEVAQRTLPFLHNCINELRILEVCMPPGSICCWVFTSALEVLHTCERFNDSAQVENYSLYTASLWAYAKDKLQELGLLCGLMPLMSPKSEQLHSVVLLRAGMGDEEFSENKLDDRNPVDKLRVALSSNSAFQRHYVELSELAMSTFKHIKRIRSARLIGRDLADFYMKLGEPQKAATFLSGMLESCSNEGWDFLAAENRLNLVRCYQMSQDYEKCVNVCAQIAASGTVDEAIRKEHFTLMFSVAREIPKDSLIMMSGRGLLVVTSVRLVAQPDIIISDTDIRIIVEIQSMFIDGFQCSQLSLSLSRLDAAADHQPETSDKVLRRSSDVKAAAWTAPELHFEEHINRAQKFVGLVCVNPQSALRRRDSQIEMHNKEEHQSEQSCAGNESSTRNIILENHNLVPGRNVVEFNCKAGDPGSYTLGQMTARAGRLEFSLRQSSTETQTAITYKVVSESPRVFLIRAAKNDLVAGAEQDLLLSVNIGSCHIEPDTIIRLQASKGLLLKAEEAIENGDETPVFMQSVECLLPVVGPFQTVTCKVKVLAEVPAQKDSSSFERKILVVSPWSMEKQAAHLVFMMPFHAQHKLHTTNSTKFIQVIVQGLQSDCFQLCEPTLEVRNRDDAHVVSLNPVGQKLVVHKDQNACYVWQLAVDNIPECPKLQLTFTVNYAAVADREKCGDPVAVEQLAHCTSYKHKFELSNYKTLYTIHSEVEPIGGSKFCRMGSICHMNVVVACATTSSTAASSTSGETSNVDAYPSLMYEVLADQMSWAVCGRTAGVISMAECGEHNVTLDVMPLTRGFLPVPNVRLSKYLPALDPKTFAKDSPKRSDAVTMATTAAAMPQPSSPGLGPCPRLEPFTQGQVFNQTKAIQVQVLPALGTNPSSEGGGGGGGGSGGIQA